MSESVICEVFRSPRREGMYLFVPREEGLARVPEALLQAFGSPEPALVLQLDAGRRLARADAGEVLAAIAEQGFYLQMPPTPGPAAAVETAGVVATAPAASPVGKTSSC